MLDRLGCIPASLGTLGTAGGRSHDTRGPSGWSAKRSDRLCQASNALHKVPSNPDICLPLRRQGREFHAKLGFFKNAKFTMRWAPVKTHCCGYYGLKNMVTGHRLRKLADFLDSRHFDDLSGISTFSKKHGNVS